ncbi:Aminomethyltransferase folate-binding domain-containing protein [Guyanagaster necrorhizus]|uniref:Aminomethyltransferase folate-binding domain-containing protein n=1 Tax=Guyanagaster necrorhizus TaxID=856835 RepID=A0A9P7VZJ1_9AGAR|nr:Aminomethyltransferase folate-binding domain-containing protein [Guyanagaster necrorhizus MCA 3950]KAG7449295.1 Aminomethyltransferase folate-binding domain-containing protein [Guyanagaster necrorhizus MCA 3950]
MFPSLTPTIAPVPFRSFLSVFGSQASEFLHGILATSVQEPRRPAFSTVLNAQGRVLYDVFLHTQKDEKGKPGYIIEYDSRASEAPPLYDLLKRYVLRSKVKIRDVSQEYDAWAAWGSPEHSHWETQRKWHWEHSGAMEPIWPAESEWPWGLEDGIIRDRRAPGMGSRILVRKGDRPKESLSHDIQTSDAYTLLRILKGVPEGLVDIPPLHAFPMDSNLDIMGGLDFRKGCYVGQELTVRTYHTGVIRKRVLPVVIREHQMYVFKLLVRIMFVFSACHRSSPVAQSLPSGLDIRPITRKESQNKSPHPRGSSKLLTSLHGHGLVLFRLEHLKNGNLTEEEPQQFALQTDGSATWIVEPQWPQWWDWCRRSGVL